MDRTDTTARGPGLVPVVPTGRAVADQRPSPITHHLRPTTHCFQNSISPMSMVSFFSERRTVIVLRFSLARP